MGCLHKLLQTMCLATWAAGAAGLQIWSSVICECWWVVVEYLFKVRQSTLPTSLDQLKLFAFSFSLFSSKNRQEMSFRLPSTPILSNHHFPKALKKTPPSPKAWWRHRLFVWFKRSSTWTLVFDPWVRLVQWLLVGTGYFLLWSSGRWDRINNTDDGDVCLTWASSLPSVSSHEDQICTLFTYHHK